MWFFPGLRLSLGHFGQQAHESPVSQLQNIVPTSSVPPFIVDLLTFKDYPRSHSFFSMEILEGVKRQTSRAAYNGPNQQWYGVCIFLCKNHNFFDTNQVSPISVPLIQKIAVSPRRPLYWAFSPGAWGSVRINSGYFLSLICKQSFFACLSQRFCHSKYYDTLTYVFGLELSSIWPEVAENYFLMGW